MGSITNEHDRFQYFLKIADLQHQDGYFILNHHFAATLGLDYNDIKYEANQKDFDEDVWATILAMSFFIRRFQQYKSHWQPIIARCNDWLVKYSECPVDMQQHMFDVALNQYIKE